MEEEYVITLKTIFDFCGTTSSTLRCLSGCCGLPVVAPRNSMDATVGSRPRSVRNTFFRDVKSGTMYVRALKILLNVYTIRTCGEPICR